MRSECNKDEANRLGCNWNSKFLQRITPRSAFRLWIREWASVLVMKLQWLIVHISNTSWSVCVYSYFEKGCREKCMRQSRKVLWAVLSSLFFKEIWNHARETMDVCLRVLKKSNKSRSDSYSVKKTVYYYIPYYLSGLSRAHFFRRPFSKQMYTRISSCLHLHDI